MKKSEHSGVLTRGVNFREQRKLPCRLAHALSLIAVIPITPGMRRFPKRKITFVTLLKSNSEAYHFGNRRKPDLPQVLDQKTKLPGHQATFRRNHYVDPETGKEYHFLTNSTKMKASEVAAIYKERWQIELFFKWVKQNLKVKTFLGTSSNAVLTQLWIALCLCLLLSYLKFLATLGWSLAQILRLLLRLNLFTRRPLADLLKTARQNSTDCFSAAFIVELTMRQQ